MTVISRCVMSQGRVGLSHVTWYLEIDDALRWVGTFRLLDILKYQVSRDFCHLEMNVYWDQRVVSICLTRIRMRRAISFWVIPRWQARPKCVKSSRDDCHLGMSRVSRRLSDILRWYITVSDTSYPETACSSRYTGIYIYITLNSRWQARLEIDRNGLTGSQMTSADIKMTWWSRDGTVRFEMTAKYRSLTFPDESVVPGYHSCRDVWGRVEMTLSIYGIDIPR
jgi:hypothetical protein